MGRRRLTAEAWTGAALEAFAEGGLVAVAVEPLAARLGATKGSFYWHFATRDALVTAALERWEAERTEQIIALLAQQGDPRDRLRWLAGRLVGSVAGDRLEVAILAAADHPLVAPAVRRVFERRLGYTVGLFEQLGYPAATAAARGMLLHAAYTGHQQVAVRVPGVYRMSSVGGGDGYVEALVELVLADAPGADAAPSGAPVEPDERVAGGPVASDDRGDRRQ